MAAVGNPQMRFYSARCKADLSEIEALLHEIDRNDPIKVRRRDTLATAEGSFAVCRVVKDDFADAYVCTNGARTLILSELHLSFGYARHYRNGEEIVHDRRALPPYDCQDATSTGTGPFNYGGFHEGGYTGMGDPNMRIFDSR